MKKIIQFCRECINELKKVSWPSRSEVVASVKVVLISTIFIAVALGILDWAFMRGLRLIFA